MNFAYILPPEPPVEKKSPYELLWIKCDYEESKLSLQIAKKSIELGNISPFYQQELKTAELNLEFIEKFYLTSKHLIPEQCKGRLVYHYDLREWLLDYCIIKYFRPDDYGEMNYYRYMRQNNGFLSPIISEEKMIQEMRKHRINV